MPYIITIAPSGVGFGSPTIPRHAVATLEEARDFVEKTEGYDGNAYDDLPESGATVGPLPGGTIIEVKPA